MSSTNDSDDDLPVTPMIEELMDIGAVYAPENSVLVTPEMAERWLGSNDHNRRLDHKRVLLLSGAMTRGEFQLNGETVVFDRDGNLRDGQHRLQGIVKSGVAVQTIVVYGVAPESQETMDQVSVRTFGDMLHLRGEASSTELAAVVRLIHSWERAGRITNQSASVPATPAQLFACLDRHTDDPKIRESVATSSRSIMRSPALSRSHVATLRHLYLRHEHQAIDIDFFFVHLASGESLGSTSPILLLRNRLMADAAKSVTEGKLPPVSKTALSIKAMNAYLQGEEMRQLRWAGGGANPEPFPKIIHADQIS